MNTEKVKRYTFNRKCTPINDAWISEDEVGQYVSYESYAILEAEKVALEEELERVKADLKTTLEERDSETERAEKHRGKVFDLEARLAEACRANDALRSYLSQSNHSPSCNYNHPIPTRDECDCGLEDALKIPSPTPPLQKSCEHDDGNAWSRFGNARNGGYVFKDKNERCPWCLCKPKEPDTKERDSIMAPAFASGEFVDVTSEAETLEKIRLNEDDLTYFIQTWIKLQDGGELGIWTYRDLAKAILAHQFKALDEKRRLELAVRIRTRGRND